MTDKSPPQSRKLVPQKVGAVDNRRRPRGLTRAIRTAIDALVFDRCTREEACKKAGITERALYLALEKPEVAAHWNAQVHVLRVGERAANIHALAGIRDKSGNAMAVVQAARSLDQLEDSAAAAAKASQIQPGLVIVIQPAPERPQPVGEIIDVTSNDDDRH